MTAKELFNKWFKPNEKSPIFGDNIDIVCNTNLVITKLGKNVEDSLKGGLNIKTITLYLKGDVEWTEDYTKTSSYGAANLLFHIVDTEEEMDNLLNHSYILRKDVEYILNNPLATINIIQKDVRPEALDSELLYITYATAIGTIVNWEYPPSITGEDDYKTVPTAKCMYTGLSYFVLSKYFNLVILSNLGFVKMLLNYSTA